MASKPATVTQRDVTRILKGAAAAGVEMAIIATPGEVRFMPVSAIAKPEPPSALEQWKLQRASEKARG